MEDFPISSRDWDSDHMLLVNGGIVVYSLGVAVCMLSGYHTHIHCRAWGQRVSVRHKKKDEIDHLVVTK